MTSTLVPLLIRMMTTFGQRVMVKPARLSGERMAFTS
jgi:hypothetical protein